MNVHHLELFYYVAKHGGIGPAVRNIPYGIQQPAVSGQILALEETLGTRLFQRRPFDLTPSGRRLAEFITPFFENLGEVAAELRGEVGQRLRLAASAQALRDHVPDLLKILHQQQPLTRLCLQEAYQAEAEALLGRHEIDLAITELADRPAAGIQAHTLLRLPLVLVVRGDSPLKSTRELWTEETFRHPLIALAGNQTLTRQFHDELRRRHDRQWPVSIEASSIELVETYVAEGFGVGLSVQVPNKPPRQDGVALRTLPLTGFAPLIVAAFWQGKLPPVPASFLELAKKTRRRDAAQGVERLRFHRGHGPRAVLGGRPLSAHGTECRGYRGRAGYTALQIGEPLRTSCALTEKGSVILRLAALAQDDKQRKARVPSTTDKERPRVPSVTDKRKARVPSMPDKERRALLQ